MGGPNCAAACRRRDHSPTDSPLMGWVGLLLLMSASFAGLWLLRARGGLLTGSLAALMLGGSGYALQGRPSRAGSPTHRNPALGVQSLAEARHAFFGNFSAEESWL